GRQGGSAGAVDPGGRRRLPRPPRPPTPPPGRDRLPVHRLRPLHRPGPPRPGPPSRPLRRLRQDRVRDPPARRRPDDDGRLTVTAPLAVSLDVAGRPAVVVGGGPEAVTRVCALRHGDAEVTVITPAPAPRIVALADAGEVGLHRRGYR